MEFTGNIFFSGTARAATAARRQPVNGRALPLPDLPGTEALQFFGWLFAQVQLDVSAYRVGPLLRRLPSCLRFLRAADIPAAWQRLEANPALIPAAVSTSLLGVTQFHRDNGVFETVADQVLPELLLGSPRIRIWSAACSDGPELYSIAMLLEEAGRLTRAELVGSDCRPDAIRRAVAGRYPVALVESFCARRRADHFVANGNGFVQVNNRLRAATNWRVADLLSGALEGQWDLVLWRNMSIYLTSIAADRCWRAIADAIRPGRFLITGKADHPPAALRWRRVAPCIYQKPHEVACA